MASDPTQAVVEAARACVEWAEEQFRPGRAQESAQALRSALRALDAAGAEREEPSQYRFHFLRAELDELHEMLRAAGWDRDGERTVNPETAGQFLRKLLVSGRDTWAEAHRLRADLARVEAERDAERERAEAAESAFNVAESLFAAERARVERVRAAVAALRRSAAAALDGSPMRTVRGTDADHIEAALDGEP